LITRKTTYVCGKGQKVTFMGSLGAICSRTSDLLTHGREKLYTYQLQQRYFFGGKT
jgi:hypothetical protein